MSNPLILYVEDDATTRETIRRAPTSNGYEIVLATDGKEGWNAYQTTKPALVMTGLRMPVVSGEELIQRIREVDKDVPILVLTGYANMELASSLFNDFSICEYLSKPVSIEELIKSIQTCLSRTKQSATNLLEKKG